jgi:xylulokinase
MERRRQGEMRRGRSVAVRAIKSEDCVLAIDVGTGGTKAALVSKLGNVVASAFHPHPDPVPSIL